MGNPSSERWPIGLGKSLFTHTPRSPRCLAAGGALGAKCAWADCSNQTPGLPEIGPVSAPCRRSPHYRWALVGNARASRVHPVPKLKSEFPLYQISQELGRHSRSDEGYLRRKILDNNDCRQSPIPIKTAGPLRSQ